MLSIAGVVVTCFAIAVVGHGAGDEHDGRTEQVLATAISRSRSFLATAVVALGGATWLLLVTGVGTALGLGLQAGGGGDALVELRRRRARAVAGRLDRCAALALLLYAAEQQVRRGRLGRRWRCSSRSASSASCSSCPPR